MGEARNLGSFEERKQQAIELERKRSKMGNGNGTEKRNDPKEGLNQKLQITIVAENGQVAVNAPFQDKITCLGMLEIAKAIVLNFKNPGNKIIVPNVIPPKDLKGP